MVLVLLVELLPCHQTQNLGAVPVLSPCRVVAHGVLSSAQGNGICDDPHLPVQAGGTCGSRLGST